ncbi:MAG: hypothetical protein JOZ32_09230 [Bryobacterales bacterium]|nr:hypothetical protein [Bryobacterales bacterium]
MASGSISVRRPFAQNSGDALRHLKTLTDSLRKVAWAGLIGGFGCGVIAFVLSHSLGAFSSHSSNGPGFPEISGITAVARFMAVALIAFSILYLIASWGLSRGKTWARYAGAAVFIGKILLCVSLGRGSVASMVVFLLIASLDIYGLWVLLSKATAQLFTSPSLTPNQTPESSQAPRKPANLVT